MRLAFSKRKYPHIRKHFLAAVSRGWPRRLVLNRRGSDARRSRLLRGYAARASYDRDEYPPAVGRGKGRGLERGRHPRGWKADVRYVPSSENRSHGASLGAKLSRYCNGTRFPLRVPLTGAVNPALSGSVGTRGVGLEPTT